MARPGPARPWPELGETDGAAVPRRRSRVRAVEVDSESVLYDEKSGRLHFLNSSASAVWWLIDGTMSVDALAAAVADRFADPSRPDTSTSSLHDDVVTLLAGLGSQELIEAVVRTPSRIV